MKKLIGIIFAGLALFGVTPARAATLQLIHESTGSATQNARVATSTGSFNVLQATSAAIQTMTGTTNVANGSTLTVSGSFSAPAGSTFSVTGSSITFGQTNSTTSVKGITKLVDGQLDFNSQKGVNVASATASADVPRFSQVAIIQMISTTTTTNKSNNTTTFANTSLCGAIITRVANSEIWLVAEQPTFTNNPANAEIRFTRNGSAIGNTHLGSYANTAALLFGNSGIYLGSDAPAAAAGTTESYCTQIKSTSGGTNVGTGDGTTLYNQQMFMIEVNKL